MKSKEIKHESPEGITASMPEMQQLIAQKLGISNGIAKGYQDMLKKIYQPFRPETQQLIVQKLGISNGIAKGYQDMLSKGLKEIYQPFTFHLADTSLLKEQIENINKLKDQTKDLFDEHNKVEELKKNLRKSKIPPDEVENLKKELITKNKKIATFEASIDKLVKENEQIMRISFLLYRVNDYAKEKLKISNDFRNCFLEEKKVDAFVMSIDIRRSTDLMLKARSPENFVEFIDTLRTDLEDIIKKNFGIIDKFTGDGILAFFPDFYTGTDAAYYTVAAADKCHEIFNEHYRKFRRLFYSVLDTGLGIGIDFGSVNLVQMPSGPTVMGVPVVYACRFSGSPPGVTLVNQAAYEEIIDKIGHNCSIKETSIEIKHEGCMIAYQVRLNGREYTPKKPKWMEESSNGDFSSDETGDD